MFIIKLIISTELCDVVFFVKQIINKEVNFKFERDIYIIYSFIESNNKVYTLSNLYWKKEFECSVPLFHIVCICCLEK